MRCIFSVYHNELRLADLARLYHIARGVELGLALGGGGAWAGAYRRHSRIRRAGLYFDRVAGTSAGAIIAVGLAPVSIPSICSACSTTK
ncbi:MAG: hypothetical protein H6939_05715 [Burkholderiales bacterium]|nr:hypothetical protein [Burkholderiales bacterium]